MHRYVTEKLGRQREREPRRSAGRYALLGPAADGAVRSGTMAAGRRPGSAWRWPEGHAMPDIRAGGSPYLPEMA